MTLREIYYSPSKAGSFGGVRQLQIQSGQTQKSVKQFLSQQDPYTLHKPARRHFTRRKVIVSGIDQQFQADLVDLSKLKRYNRDYRYLLTCIDVFSKYAWAIPLKDKTGKSLVKAFGEIVRERKPLQLQTDKGSEFTNRRFQTFLKENQILFFTSFNEVKAAIVERFNRTLKTKMWRYFTAKNTLKYVDVLQPMLDAYNRSYHRSIKTTPVSVTWKNQDEIWQNLYGKPMRERKPKFQPGDVVRISKNKQVFEKGYLPNWTEEIFTIVKRIPGNPPTYKLKDYHSEELQGSFYEQELQKIVKKDDEFLIEAILETRKRGKRKQYLVKWLGWPSSFNSWVNESDMKAYQP